MASRKEQKEQARARRLADEQAAAGRARKRRRMEMLGGVVIVAVVIVVVAIAVSAGSSSSSGPLKGSKATAAEAQVTTLLKGIPQTGTTLGSPSAPVTMTYFGDLECPVCQAFTLGEDGGGLPQLISNDVRAGKVKIDYRSFCTATCNGPGQGVFNTQQVAAEAAGMQKLFWNYCELFYREQGAEDSGYVTPAFLQGLATHTPGLNLKNWQTDRGDPSLLAQVQSDEAAASADGVSGTPTVIFKGPKGTEPVPAGVPTYSELQSAIKAVT